MKGKIRNLLHEIEADIIEFTQKIIQIRSYTEHEEELAMFVKKKMIDLGYDDVMVDKLGNVIGVMGNGSTKILFDSHLDTVEVNDEQEWAEGPFSGSIVDGRIYGRGAVDMKASLAATVYAGYAVKKLNMHKGKTVYISASVMEEDYDGEAVYHICQNLEPDFAVICEPSSMKLALGQRGRAVLKVDMEGVSAHGSAPEKGVNAIYKMNTIISRIEELGKKLISTEGEKGSLALTKIESEAVSINAIPAKCSIYLDRRLVLHEDKEYIAKEMEDLLSGTDASWEIFDIEGESWTGEKILFHSFLPAWETDKNHKLTRACVSSFKEIHNRNPEMIKWDFSTNGVATAKLGIPTIGIGPGDAKLAHMRDENCKISEIMDAFQFYVNLMNYL